MIDFEEELKKFKPSLEVDETEDAIRGDHETDMVDLLAEMMNEYRDNR